MKRGFDAVPTFPPRRSVKNDIGLSENIFVTLLYGLLLKVPKVNLNILVRAVAPYVQALQ